MNLALEGGRTENWNLFRARRVIRAASQGSQQDSREAFSKGRLDILGFLSKQLSEMP